MATEEMTHVDLIAPGAADQLVVTRGEAPLPGPTEVLIEVAFAGVNRPDVFQRQGAYPAPPGASHILGLEVSGLVMGVGSQVSRWRVGDRVCALTNGGGYAERVCVDEDHCLPLPTGLSLRQAAALPETCFTVWNNVFDRAQLKAGETLLVHAGASGIGSMAIQMAVAMGARVFTTASTADKCQACLALGAELAINYSTEDFVEQVEAKTAGHGVDVILDMVGGDYLARNMRCAAVEGRIVNIAFLRGAKAELNLMPIMLKRLTMTGSTLRPQSVAAKAAIAERLREHIWPLIEAGAIQPLMHPQAFNLDQVADAHRLLETNQVLGKLVLAVNAELDAVDNKAQ